MKQKKMYIRASRAHKGKRLLTEEIKEKIARLHYEYQVDTKAIASRFELSAATIRKILNEKEKEFRTQSDQSQAFRKILYRPNPALIR